MYTVRMKKLSVAPVYRKARERGLRFAAELARETGVSYPTARKWWNDEIRQIDPDTLIRFADYFGVEPGELIERKQ